MRLTIGLFALALAALQLELWLADDRRPGLAELEAALAEQSAINQRLIERNADLKAEINNLREGSEAIEERARSELGLIMPSETFYQIAEGSRPVGH